MRAQSYARGCARRFFSALMLGSVPAEGRLVNPKGGFIPNLWRRRCETVV